MGAETYKGAQGVVVELTDSELVVRRRRKEPRVIERARITGVRLREPTRLRTRGHLQLLIDGATKRPHNTFNAVSDPDSLLFDWGKRDAWRHLYAQLLDGAMLAAQVPLPSPSETTAPTTPEVEPPQFDDAATGTARVAPAHCSACGAVNPGRFCPACGLEQRPRDIAPAVPDAVSAAAEHPGACPICRKDDQVQSIAAVVGTGTSSTVGRIDSGRRSASVSMNSTSGLASRFEQPRKPSSWWVGVIVWLALTGIAMTFPEEARTLSAVFVYGGIFLGVVASAMYRATTGFQTREAAWKLGTRRLRGGYYCFRDDVAFTDDGALADKPERFVVACHAS